MRYQIFKCWENGPHWHALRLANKNDRVCVGYNWHTWADAMRYALGWYDGRSLPPRYAPRSF